MVVIVPTSIPKLSCKALAIGARQLVVHDATGTAFISHTALLTRAFAPLADDATSVWQARSIQFIHLLDEIVQEPAIYLMARKIA